VIFDDLFFSKVQAMENRTLGTSCAGVLAVLCWAGLCLAQVAEKDNGVSQTPKTEADKVTIPLDQIWSNGMPETQNVDELNKQSLKKNGNNLVREISAFLVATGEDSILQRQPAKPGFVVEGRGLNALENMRVVLKADKPTNVVAEGSDAAIVFFMYPAGRDVQIREVSRIGGKITIGYCFVGYANRGSKTRFALIPLGRLPDGKYEVSFHQLPMLQKVGSKFIPYSPPRTAADANEMLSQPFTFEVQRK
jgi:hypothetical protein